MLHLEEYAHQGSTSPHAWDNLPSSRTGIHPGAAARHARRKAELEREAASSPAPAFSQAPYVPGCGCEHSYTPETYSSTAPAPMPRA